jgi:hypothetical protein
MAPQQKQQPIMKGGSRAHIFEMLMKFSGTINAYILAAIILAIVFVKQIPIGLRSQAGTFFGRAVLFALTIFVADYYSWTNGVLMALLSLLLLSLSPRNTEGFQSSYNTNVKVISDKHKWWVEQVFKEEPLGIEEDYVKTSAVQDNSASQSSTSGQGGSHSK